MGRLPACRYPNRDCPPYNTRGRTSPSSCRRPAEQPCQQQTLTLSKVAIPQHKRDGFATAAICFTKGLTIDTTSVLPPEFQTHPALQGATLIATLRNEVHQQVLEIRQNGQQIILKRYLGPSASKRFAVTIARLTEAQDRMRGNNLTVRVLKELPDCHTLMLSYAAGRPLQDVLQMSDAWKQLMLVHRAGQWLACLVSTTQSRPFRAWKFFAKLGGRVATYDTDDAVDTYLVRKHMDRMHQVTRRVHLLQVSYGMTHGDFHPENLFFNEDGGRLILTGFDLEIAEPIPVVRDLAKMLVWLEGFTLPGLPGFRESGIHQPLFNSLCDGYAALTPADRLVLHFHIGEQMLLFYLQSGAHRPEIRQRMALILDHWASTA